MNTIPTIEITLRDLDLLATKQDVNLPHTVKSVKGSLVTIEIESAHELKYSAFLLDKDIPHDMNRRNDKNQSLGRYKYRVLANGRAQQKCLDEPESVIKPLLSWTEQLDILNNRDIASAYLNKLDKDELEELVRNYASKIFPTEELTSRLTQFILSKSKANQVRYILNNGFTTMTLNSRINPHRHDTKKTIPEDVIDNITHNIAKELSMHDIQINDNDMIKLNDSIEHVLFNEFGLGFE